MSRLLKIIGLFCKRPRQKRLYLQKRPIILRSLLIVATPYSFHTWTTDFCNHVAHDLNARNSHFYDFLPVRDLKVEARSADTFVEVTKVRLLISAIITLKSCAT